MPCRARGQEERAVFRRLFLFVIRVSDKFGDNVNNLCADALLRLDGGSADVRRAGDHRVGVERNVGRGLVGIDVQTGGADLAAVERVKKRSLVDVGAAGGVDDDDAVLHLGDALSVDESAAVDSGSVDGDEVGLGEQLVHLNIGDAKLFLDAGDVEDIERDDVHADGLGHLAELLSDAAEADDTERLAGQLDALAVGLLLPLALAHGVAGDGNVTGAGEHVSHSELSNGLGGGLRGVLHLDAVVLGVLHVDVVEADTGADDALEAAALGLVDLLGAQLGLGANDGDIKVAQGLTKLVGLVELLNELVTHRANLLDRALIHTVGNKNTHNEILLK